MLYCLVIFTCCKKGAFVHSSSSFFYFIQSNNIKGLNYIRWVQYLQSHTLIPFCKYGFNLKHHIILISIFVQDKNIIIFKKSIKPFVIFDIQ